MTPADELRAAAQTLRNVAPQITGHLAGLADPVADWLDQTAHHYECGIRAADDVFHDDPEGHDVFLATGPGAPSPHALAVARAVLGTSHG